jgi:hypothetical protein
MPQGSWRPAKHDNPHNDGPVWVDENGCICWAGVNGEVQRLVLHGDMRLCLWEEDEVGDDEPEYIDYEDWLFTQWIPNGATHTTIDQDGGCCWWHGEPAQAADTELGWSGDLIERYPEGFNPENWRQSLRELTLKARSNGYE